MSTETQSNDVPRWKKEDTDKMTKWEIKKYIQKQEVQTVKLEERIVTLEQQIEKVTRETTELNLLTLLNRGLEDEDFEETTKKAIKKYIEKFMSERIESLKRRIEERENR
jgi:glutamyl-tRNA reductase